MGEAPLPQRARSYWKSRFSAAREELEKLLEVERAQLPPWTVVGGERHRCLVRALRSRRVESFRVHRRCALHHRLHQVGGRAGRALGWFALVGM